MKRKICFCDNLRYFREKNNLTQRQLAEKIEFSEKSVSKWENGNGLPTIETLITLAELFKTTIDDLIYEQNSKRYYLGIDGGGTKTAFMLVDDSHHIIKKITKGASNPNDVGIENTLSVLNDGIKEVSRGYSPKRITMFAGLAGCDSEAIQNSLDNFFNSCGFAAYEFDNDIENIIALGSGKSDVFAIMGTGFIIRAITDEGMRCIAGWGQLFDAGGSGYNLGKDTIYAALRESDGTGEKTIISKLIEERVGESAKDHLDSFYKEGKKYIASFSEILFKAYKENDKVAEEILKKNMKFAAEEITAAGNFVNKDKVYVSVAGGIVQQSDIIFPMIYEYLPKNRFVLEKCSQEPIFGAVLKAEKLDLHK